MIKKCSCGAKEGEVHHIPCDMERCPICKDQQLLTCKHVDKLWDKNNKIKRIPYVVVSNICSYCGELNPEFFGDEDWEKYVVPDLQDTVLCKSCFNYMKLLFPNGWKNSSQERIVNRFWWNRLIYLLGIK